MPKIAVLSGDGIGPEVMQEALKVLDAIRKRFGHTFTYEEALVGGAAYERHGEHLPESTLKICEQSDAILFGSVGGPVDHQNDPKWINAERNAILGLRKHFHLSVNLRPVKIYPSLKNLCPLKESIIEKGIDFLIVRELIGGAYFGEHKTEGEKAWDIMEYTEPQIERALRFAFEAALLRKKQVTLVDKANVLDCSRLWRKVAERVKKDYPDLSLDFMYVDNAAMQLIKNPSAFDVLVTENLFGDILSDEAAVLPGSLGLMPSASFGDHIHLYEPSGGSAPDIAGQGIANPIAQILSAALMLRYSFGLEKEAECIELAVEQALEDNQGTRDLTSSEEMVLTTSQMGNRILERL